MTIHVARLVSDVRPFHGLGRHVEHDSASRGFAFDLGALALPLHPVEWTISTPVLNQLNTEGCTGNAFAQFLNCDVNAPLRTKLGREWFTEGDALNIYDLATHLDGLHNSGPYAPQVDDGSSGLGAVKACQQLGYVTAYQHTFSFDTFLGALAIQPVCVGTAWTNDMENSDANGLVSVGSLDDSNISGGHEYLGLGFNPLTKLVKFRNSWGADWGQAGSFFITYSDFHRLLMSQGDVVVPQVAT